MKRGFTIIELLMVVAILAVLLGIITTAATASIRQSREQQTRAVKLILQNGIAAYKARKDEWPGKLDEWKDKSHDGTVGYLSKGDYDEVVQEVLRVSTGKYAKNRVMNPVGLTVMDVSQDDNTTGCVDFRSVNTKNNRHVKQLEYNEVTVVYPKKDTGKAYRYVIEYNAETEDVSVMTQEEFNAMADRNDWDHWNRSEVWH